MTISATDLEFIIQHIPAGDRRRAKRATANLQRSGVRQNGRWNHLAFKTGSSEFALYELVLSEFDRRLRAFVTASTLEDQFDSEQATSIYLLANIYSV